MRLLLLAALLGAQLIAATQIRDTGYTGVSGTLFSGKMLITAPDLTTADGRTVLRWQQEFTITNGDLSLALEPNDTASPSGTSYLVRFTPTKGVAWTERWIVPSSATPLKVHQVRVMTVPTPSLLILPSQISGSGAAVGQCLAWGGSSWEPRPLSYGVSFVAKTSVTILGAEHGMRSDDLLVKCYDDATPRHMVEPDTVTIHPTTFDVTVTFTLPQSGKCVVGR